MMFSFPRRDAGKDIGIANPALRGFSFVLSDSQFGLVREIPD